MSGDGHRCGAVEMAEELFVGFDAAIFANSQEDDSIDGGLDGVVELMRREFRISIPQVDILREKVSPAFNFFQKGRSCVLAKLS